MDFDHLRFLVSEKNQIQFLFLFKNKNGSDMDFKRKCDNASLIFIELCTPQNTMGKLLEGWKQKKSVIAQSRRSDSEIWIQHSLIIYEDSCPELCPDMEKIDADRSEFL